MTRSPILAVLAMISVQACSAADPNERPPADAGRDSRTTPRADAPANSDTRGADNIDVTDDGAPPSSDGRADVEIPPFDSPDDRATGDGTSDGLGGFDARFDGASPDGAPADADAAPPFDATTDPVGTSCFVSFTVSGVVWAADAGVPDAQTSARIVRVVGDIANLGSWSPTAGVPLAETGSGIWSGTANLRDQQLIEFKFVKLQGSTPEWEGWQPYDSNRSLCVECAGEGGVLIDAGDGAAPPDDAADDAPDAAPDTPSADAWSAEGGVDAPLDTATADAGDSSSDSSVTGPARGRSYIGVFGVRPPDATK